MAKGKKIFEKKVPYTVVRNEILEEIMPKLSGSAWKVLSAIIRATMGWQKEEDALSYTQLMERAGIGSRSTISKALSELKKGGYILNHRPANPSEPKSYALNEDYVLILRSTETGPARSTESVPRVVQKVDTQKKDLKKPTVSKDTVDGKQVQWVMGQFLSRMADPNWRQNNKGLSQACGAATKKMLARGFSGEEIIECYDERKGEPFWADKPLTLVHINKDIDEWKRAGGKSAKDQGRRKGDYDRPADYYEKALAEKEANGS